MRVLILGASGMLGSILMRVLYNNNVDVYGTVRSVYPLLSNLYNNRILSNVVDISDFWGIINLLKPDVVINAIGIIKQLDNFTTTLDYININSKFPHTLYCICNGEHSCKLIHYSSDCVFDGKSDEPYVEHDICTASDVYGLSKYLGELHYENSLTIRTSIIGHELKNHVSLIDWFLNQHGDVNGYTNVIWNGLPVSEHAKILMDYIFPNINKLNGLYHVSGIPISKYNLLDKVRNIYDHECNLIQYDKVSEYKVLNCNKFMSMVGYVPKPWDDLISDMYANSDYFVK